MSRLTERLANLIGSGSVDDYHWTSGWNTAALQLLVGLRAGDRLLDVGCGSGRLARGLYGWFGEGYVGVDIMPELIDYCRRTYPRFRFVLLDLQSDLYNPASGAAPDSVVLDLPDRSFDCIALFSVLTHVTTEVTRQYFREFGRLLAPGGSVLLTCFLLEGIEGGDTPADHAFPHRHDDGCYYENRKVVSDAVAYREKALRGLLDEAGLEVVFQEAGSWRGRPGLGYQDIVIAQRRADIEASGAADRVGEAR